MFQHDLDRPGYCLNGYFMTDTLQCQEFCSGYHPGAYNAMNVIDNRVLGTVYHKLGYCEIKTF